MGRLKLGIVVVSVEGLKKLDLSSNSEMNVYVIVTLNGGALSEQKAETNVNTKGGQNSRLMTFIVDRSVATQSLNSYLTFTLISRTLLEHKNIGEIKVSISELMQSATNGRSMRQVSRPVKESSGHTTNGKLNFAYKFIAGPQAQARPPHLSQAQACPPQVPASNLMQARPPSHVPASNLMQTRPPPHVQQAQAPHVQQAAARKYGKWGDIGTKVAVGMGVSATGAYIAGLPDTGISTFLNTSASGPTDPFDENLFYDEDGLSGTEISTFLNTSALDPTNSLDENFFYDEDGLSGTEISTTLDTSAFDPTDSLDENLFYNEDGLSGNEISTFLDTSASAFDPTDSFDASNSIAGNLFYDQAASSSTATATFPDSSVIQSMTSSSDASDSLLGTAIDAFCSFFL